MEYNEVGEVQEGGLGPELSGFGRTLINIIVNDNNLFFYTINSHRI
jgi:hypothetical protein